MVSDFWHTDQNRRIIRKGQVIYMGRSRQGIEPRKNFTVRLSAKEHRLLEQKAQACGMNPSWYIRQLISNGGMVDVTLPEQRRDLINQISRIGNNINQIAHRANADGWISEWDVERVIAKMEEVKELMREVAGRWQ